MNINRNGDIMSKLVKSQTAPGSLEARLANQPGAARTTEKLHQRIQGAVHIAHNAAQDILAAIEEGSPQLPPLRLTDIQENLLDYVADGHQGVSAELVSQADTARKTWFAALRALQDATSK